MSRSMNTENPNPAARFIQWDGERGGFRYYDKQQEERVPIGLPFGFLVLDTLSTIKGWNEVEKSNYWSNEVRDIKKDVLNVRSKGGLVATGFYDDVIANRNCRGAKYCQSVYIGAKVNGKLAIWNIQMVGACLGAWIDFRKKNKIYDGAIQVNSFVEGTKGRTTYQIPVFEKIEVSDETDAEAKLLDKQLQEYLKLYFQRTSESVASAHVEEKIEPVPIDAEYPEAINQEPADDLPF
jgi:hypothetical protein